MAASPHYAKALTGCGRALWGMARYDEALEMLEAGRRLGGDVPSVLGALGQVHAMAGHRDEARGFLGQLYEMARIRHVPASCLALVHAGLGEHEAALAHLERGVERHEMPLVQMKVHPGYDALRGQARFEGLLRRMNLLS